MSLALKKDTVDSLPLFTKNSQKFHGGRAVFFFESGQKSYRLRCVFQFFSMSELWHVPGVEMKQARVKKFSSLKPLQHTFERKFDPEIRIDKGSFIYKTLSYYFKFLISN